MGSIIKVNEYKDFGNNAIMTSDGAGNVTPNASGIKNTPNFFINKSADQAINDVTNTIVTFDTVVIDTNSGYDGTNKYTIPAGEGGTYLISYQIVFNDAQEKITESNTQLHVNGVPQSNYYLNISTGVLVFVTHSPSLVLNLSAGDELKVNAYSNTTDSGTTDVVGGSNYNSWLQGYKLIT
jgi:hypothetical protein